MFTDQHVCRTKLPILKVQPNSTMEVVALRQRPLGLDTHWIGSRSFLCPERDCLACARGIGSRWVALLPVKVISNGRPAAVVCLLEFSTGSFDRLFGLMRMESCDSLCGYKLRLERRSKRSGLIAEPLFEADQIETPAFPDWLLVDAIATLYGLPSCIEGTSADDWSEHVNESAARLVRLAVERQEK